MADENDFQFKVKSFRDQAETLAGQIADVARQKAALVSQRETLDKRADFFSHQLEVVRAWDLATGFAFKERTGRELTLDERASKEDDRRAVEILNGNFRAPLPQYLLDKIAEIKRKNKQP